MSGVLQRSSLLLIIYINDLDDNIISNVLCLQRFTRVNNNGDKQHLRSDLDKLVKWSEKWQMLLNFGKCICLHTGHANLDVNYEIGDTVLCKRTGLRLCTAEHRFQHTKNGPEHTYMARTGGRRPVVINFVIGNIRGILCAAPRIEGGGRGF